MAKIKISQLPAKAANVAATDLLEVSEVSGLTYVSKKITGAELVGNRVPYTGATSDVDLGEYELKAGQIELDQSPTGTAGVAVTRWNDSLGSTETTLKGGSVILKNGVDLVARVVNKVSPNTTLTKAAYPVVKISGAQGQRLAVDYAQANNDNNSADTLGVVTETIATNQEGFIMTVGQLEGINTTGSLQGETWLDGDVLYLSPTVPGAVTKVKPTGATGHIVVIGYVEYAHAINGKIYVKVMNGWELDELHNVYINQATLANNDALIYESSTQLWKNKPVTETIISLSDVTTNNVSTSKHGFAPKLPNDASKFLDGTGNYTSPPTGLTVGTTAVTSGTDGRVFFQAGGVVQQDANFTFDNTLKRLTLKAVGTAATDIPFVVRNSADTQNLMSIAGNGDIAIGLNASGVTAASYPFTSIGSGAKASQYGLSIGTNAGANQDNGDRRNIYIGHDVASSGTNRTAAYNIGIGNRALLSINSGQLNVAIGLGPSPGEGAGEAISTGSENVIVGVGAGASITTGGTNTAIGRYAGSQNVTGSRNTQVGYAVDQGVGTNKSDITAIGYRLRSSHNGNIMIGSSGSAATITPSIADDSAQFHFRSDLQSFFFNKNTNVVLRSNSSLTSGTHFEAAATNTFTIHSGTAPVTNISDAFQQYSADRGGVAGKASAHFRAEDGTINVIGDLSGFGTSTPGARLDVRAQGALSTDIAFRVRNSADSANIVSFTGNGDISLGVSATGITASNNPFIAIGQSAKGSQYGVSIGNYAGSNADNGDRRNIYIGNDVASVGSNRTASKNIGIGNSSLRSINSGTYNVAIGAGAAAGEAAGYDLTTGSNNVMIGLSAGSQITTASSNTSLGAYAGSNNVTGAANTQIGYAVYQGVGTNKTLNTGIGIRMKSSHDGAIMIGSSSDSSTDANSIADDAAQFHFRSTNQSFYFNKNTNVVLKSNSALTSGTDFEAAATNTITIHNGTAPTTNIATAGQLYAESGALRYRDSAGTITNVGGSVQAVVSAATVTPVYTNKFVKITAQAAALTIANPTGTWAEGQDLMIRIKDDGTARAITWDTNYRAIGVTLPTTTVLGKTTYVGVIYNSDDAKWDVIGVTTQA